MGYSKVNKRCRNILYVNYHRNFIKDFALISEPLYRVTAKKKFQRGEEQQQAFEHLKEASRDNFDITCWVDSLKSEHTTVVYSG